MPTITDRYTANQVTSLLSTDRFPLVRSPFGAGDTGGINAGSLATSIFALMSAEPFTAADEIKLDGIETGADVTDADNVAAAGAVMDSDISEAEGFVRKTGAGTYAGLKTNFTAIVDPGVNDDDTQGYSVGSMWINTVPVNTRNRLFICVDNSTGAASWTELCHKGFTGSNRIMTASTSEDAVTSIPVAGHEIVGRITGGIQAFGQGEMTEEAAPATGDWLVAFLSTGELRKFDVGNVVGDANVRAALAAAAAAVDVNAQRITGVGAPSAGTDAATKDYVDALAGGTDYKESVRAASTANVNIANELEAGDALDGVTLAENDRVLLKDQTTASENGIYVVPASGAASRSTDANTDALVTAGMSMFVSEGATNSDAIFRLTTNDPITLGVTNLTFTQAAGALANNSVSNAHLADMVQDTFKGRANGAGTGDPQDLTAAQARTILNVEDGANNYTHPNHTGDVTSTGDGATTIANNAVTNAKAADMVAATIKGRARGAGTGDPQDLTPSQARRIINGEMETITKATDYTLALGDEEATNAWTKGTAGDITVPPNASVNFPINTTIPIANDGAGVLTLVEGTDVTINPPPGRTLESLGQGAFIWLRQTATNIWRAYGDLVTDDATAEEAYPFAPDRRNVRSDDGRQDDVPRSRRTPADETAAYRTGHGRDWCHAVRSRYQEKRRNYLHHAADHRRQRHDKRRCDDRGRAGSHADGLCRQRPYRNRDHRDWQHDAGPGPQGHSFLAENLMSLLLNPGRFGSGGGGPAFETFAATFDGTNDYLTVTPSITATKTGHIHGYWHTKNDGTLHVIMANDNSGNDGLRLYRDANNKLNLLLKNAAGTTILHIQSLSNGHIDAQGGNFFSVNWDLAAGVYELLWNGFDDAVEIVAPVDDTVDLGGNWSVGADPDGTNKFTGDLGELFAIFGQTYAALLTDANWAKFITDADLRPVDLGSDGSTPYGVQPEFYWKADVAGTITENLGSEGNFTEVGALVAASVTPDTFVWRMPLTDFPDTGGEELNSGFDPLAAQGKTWTGVFHVESDATDSHYINAFGRHRANMEAEATAIGWFRVRLENTVAVTAVDLQHENHYQTGVKYQVVITLNVNNLNDFEFWVNGVDETSNVTNHLFNNETLDFTFKPVPLGRLGNRRSVQWRHRRHLPQRHRSNRPGHRRLLGQHERRPEVAGASWRELGRDGVDQSPAWVRLPAEARRRGRWRYDRSRHRSTAGTPRELVRLVMRSKA